MPFSTKPASRSGEPAPSPCAARSPRAFWNRPGKLDPQAIDTVRAECWPDIRDEHELHDLLMSLVALPLAMIDEERSPHWPEFYERLEQSGRAQTMRMRNCISCWIATERVRIRAGIVVGAIEPIALRRKMR